MTKEIKYEQQELPSPLLEKDRLTVVQTITHESLEDEPVQHHNVYSTQIAMVEPYSRRFMAEETWECLRFDFVEKPLLVTIYNPPTARVVNPSSEERDAEEAKVIQISFDGNNPHLEVPLRASQSFYLAANAKVFLRCAAGKKRTRVFAHERDHATS